MGLDWVKRFLIFMSLFLLRNACMFLTPIPPLGLGLLFTTFTLDLGFATKLGDGGPVGAELGLGTAGCGSCVLVLLNKTSLIAFAAGVADLIALGGLFPAGNLFVQGIIKCFYYFLTLDEFYESFQ